MTKEELNSMPTKNRLAPRFMLLFLLILLLIIPMAIRLTTQVAFAQTINNPGMEGSYQPLSECAHIRGEVANGWLDNTCWEPTAEAVYTKATVNPHTGNAAQQIELKKGRVQFAQPLTFEANRLYTVRLWLRAAAPMSVEILLRKEDAPYTTFNSLQAKLTTEWQQVTLLGLTPATSGYFMLIATTPGSFWVDDVELSSEPFVTVLPDSAISRSFFGMHIHNSAISWPATQRRIGAIRLWDADGAQWAEVNTSRGSYDWSALDAHVQRAIEHRADLLFNLGRTPRWASARPNEESNYGPGQAAEPASDEDWQAWVRAVGERYRGKIHYWEIWNEPNDAGFYSGTPEKLVDLAKQAYTILKEIDPTNRIVSPSAYRVDFLDTYLALGGGKVADIIGYHFYVDEAPEVLFTSYIANVRLTMQKHGILHKPLWNTEEGWLRPTPFGAITLPDSVAVGYVARAYILNWASGVDRYYYYAWDNHGFMNIDLTTGDSQTPTPAGIAYREVARWLIGSQMSDLQHDEHNTWQVKLTRPDGTNAYILWNPTEKRNVSIPSDWHITHYRDLSGTVHSLANAAEIEIDASPILLEEDTETTFLPLIQRVVNTLFPQ